MFVVAGVIQVVFGERYAVVGMPGKCPARIADIGLLGSPWTTWARAVRLMTRNVPHFLENW
jgi:hypothetical protein